MSQVSVVFVVVFPAALPEFKMRPWKPLKQSDVPIDIINDIPHSKHSKAAKMSKLKTECSDDSTPTTKQNIIRALTCSPVQPENTATPLIINLARKPLRLHTAEESCTLQDPMQRFTSFGCGC
jgi:hypothetical protein